MIRKGELTRLYADHPDFMKLSNRQMHNRYWMYFADSVRAARAEVHWRKLGAQAIAPVVRLFKRGA